MQTCSLPILGLRMLKIENFNAFYGASQALRDFSITVAPGEVVCLLGRNGAGKTTALKTIMGLLKSNGGRIELNGTDLTHLPPERIRCMASAMCRRDDACSRI